MKPPARTLKRKRSFHQDEVTPGGIAESSKTEHGQSPVTGRENGPSPLHDTTSDTSALTSADDIATVTSLTGVDSDEGKYASENGRLSGWLFPRPVMYYHKADVHVLAEEGNRTAEVVTAYRNATELLVEVANRDHHKAYRNPYMGFGGAAGFGTPLANSTMDQYATPYATLPSNSYQTPYANPEPAGYVTPYANPPDVLEANGPRQSNKGNDHEVDTAEPQTPKKGPPESISATPPCEALDEFEGDVEPSEMAQDEGSRPVSVGLLDGFLALANGGVLPGQRRDSDDLNDRRQDDMSNYTTLFAPPSPGDTIDEAMSRSDDDVQALVNHIANDLMNSQEPPNQAPPVNPYAAFYSSMNGKQLGAELKRLVEVVEPEVNAIKPREQVQAAHQFYTQLANCIHTRNAANVQRNHPMAFAPPPTMNYGGPVAAISPPPPPPKGYMAVPTQWQNHFAPPPPPQAQPPSATFATFVPRGNVIAPPVVRDVEEERKAAGFGFPPVLGSESKTREGGRRGKRKGGGMITNVP